MAYYKDLREHIKALEAKGKLVRVHRKINKDTELMPLVRWQFRGLPESERKAFLFDNVVDIKGKKYDIPVLVAVHAASTEIYAMGMQCKPSEIMEKWAQAQLHPIPPVVVDKGPVHEVVYMGDNLLAKGGLGEIPVPISTPGFDNAPYYSAGNWVSKDPDTGVYNIGVYRAMMKSPTRCGVSAAYPKHLAINLAKCRAKGVPLQAACILGASPNIGYVAVAGLPYESDEYAIAGGIAGEPVKLVKCKTVDILVPATAEIVIEGIIPSDYYEREAPFGEYTGYVGKEETTRPFFNVTAITHRKDAIYNAFISQFPPSESSKLRGVGTEAVFYKFLKYDCNIPQVQEVACHESSGAYQFCVIQIKKTHNSQPWQVLYGSQAINTTICKITVVVDDDIDPKDLDSVVWAMSFRMQPLRDVRIVPGRTPGLDPSVYAPEEWEKRRYIHNDGSAMLIDATRKWEYPPVSLPKKEFMENAKKIWEELELPKLTPRVPWHGYTLGYWTEENEEEAKLALKGEHYKTGEKLAKRRTKA